MEIILGVVMFTLIVLVLSGLILAARSKLVNAATWSLKSITKRINRSAPGGRQAAEYAPATVFLSPPPAAAAAPAASAG
jgi:Na+-transporting NADH:ubiquinone oxidoreductase subunit NqrF